MKDASTLSWVTERTFADRQERCQEARPVGQQLPGPSPTRSGRYVMTPVRGTRGQNASRDGRREPNAVIMARTCPSRQRPPHGPAARDRGTAPDGLDALGATLRASLEA